MSDVTSQVPHAPLPPEWQKPGAFAIPSQASPSVERRLRLWPGVILVALLWFLLTVPGWLAPATKIQFFSMFLGPIAVAAAVTGWWLFASRLRWADRLLGLFAFAAVGAVTYLFWHSSLTEAGG